MRYHNIVGQLAKEKAASCLLAFCFIFFLLSCLNFLCCAEGVEDDPFKSKNFQKFNFVAAGDFGCGDEPNRTIKSMIKKSPELIIALGDLSYDKSALCWINSITLLETDGTVKISFGDHDLTKKMIKYNDYLRHFNMTKPFYSFNHQNVHFLAMTTAKNSIVPYQKGSEQYNFVEEDLRNAKNNKSIDWIIVYSFRPFYSSVTSHSGQRELPDTYHRLFDEYGVDMVLQAHSHNYQRTFPLRYNESSYMPLFHPEIVNKEHILYIKPNGTIFLTVGTGGAELHNFTGKAPYIAEQFESHGFLNVDIVSSKKVLNLLGTFYENTDMNKKDQFIITKQK
jgi:Calcineurin-like phosphoesterase